MSTLLGRDAILGASDLRTEDVPVPEWGGDVRVRMLTGAERSEFGKSMTGADGKPDATNYVARLVAMCAVGEDGQRLFGDGDVRALAGKSAVALVRVFEAAERLNGMNGDAVDTAEKNSESAPSSASTSDSPAT